MQFSLRNAWVPSLAEASAGVIVRVLADNSSNPSMMTYAAPRRSIPAVAPPSRRIWITGSWPGAAANAIHASGAPEAVIVSGFLVPSLVYVPLMTRTVVPGAARSAARSSVAKADAGDRPSWSSEPGVRVHVQAACSARTRV